MATVGLPQWLGRPCIPALGILFTKCYMFGENASAPTPVSSAAWSQRPVGQGPGPRSCPLPFLGSWDNLRTRGLPWLQMTYDLHM